MIPPQLIIAAIIAAFGFAGGWTINGWRYQAKETERVTQLAAAQRASAQRDIRIRDNDIDAERRAKTREQGLRRDLADSRGTADRLSHAADAALRSASASLQACVERATTFKELFETVTGERRALAEKADRHVGDIQTLTDQCQ